MRSPGNSIKTGTIDRNSSTARLLHTQNFASIPAPRNILLNSSRSACPARYWMSRTRPDGLQATRRARIFFTFTASAVLVTALLAGCNHSQPAAAAMGPMPVDVVTVQQSDVPVSNEWVGTLDGYVNAQIQPQVSGYLVRQNYREGARVAKDQVLFEIDPRPFQAAVDQAAGRNRPGRPGKANSARPKPSCGLRRSTSSATHRWRRRAPSRRASSTMTSSRRSRPRPRS